MLTNRSFKDFLLLNGAKALNLERKSIAPNGVDDLMLGLRVVHCVLVHLLFAHENVNVRRAPRAGSSTSPDGSAHETNDDDPAVGVGTVKPSLRPR
jgi:hypothetical protein